MLDFFFFFSQSQRHSGLLHFLTVSTHDLCHLDTLRDEPAVNSEIYFCTKHRVHMTRTNAFNAMIWIFATFPRSCGSCGGSRSDGGENACEKRPGKGGKCCFQLRLWFLLHFKVKLTTCDLKNDGQSHDTVRTSQWQKASKVESTYFRYFLWWVLLLCYFLKWVSNFYSDTFVELQ